jgi:hypothetical protein
LDEVCLTINGERSYLWRAVDQDGNGLAILVQSRHNKKAANPPTHIEHNQGGRHGEHFAARIQTKSATAPVLFDRGLGKAEESIAPSKGRWKPFGIILIEFLKSALGIGAIRNKPVILGLT